MKVEIEVLKDTVGAGGMLLEANKIYKLKSSLATLLIRLKKARLADNDSLIPIKLLGDDLIKGLREGELLELPVFGAQKLIEEGKGEIYGGSEDEDFSGIEVVILQDTNVELNGKKGIVVERGQVCCLKPSEASALIALKKAKFPDNVDSVRVRFLRTFVHGGGYYQRGDMAKLSVTDTEELLCAGAIEVLGVEKKPC